jgi:NAD(P)-dependent dehydrogenase (short-subunit alcohol dehydrogenase family)
VLVIESDASDVAEQKRVAEVIQRAFGRLDVLLVNAGIVDYRSFGQFDEAGFDRSFAINLKEPYFLIQALLPVFANPASIVLNTSVSAQMGMPNNSVYAATKAGLISLARTLSRELTCRGISVNAISPGAISTPLYGKLGLPEEQLKAAAALLQGQIPAGRFGEAYEVAHAVAFLASDKSSYTVGNELVIDGGFRNL